MGSSGACVLNTWLQIGLAALVIPVVGVLVGRVLIRRHFRALAERACNDGGATAELDALVPDRLVANVVMGQMKRDTNRSSGLKNFPVRAHHRIADDYRWDPEDIPDLIADLAVQCGRDWDPECLRPFHGGDVTVLDVANILSSLPRSRSESH